jgi:hemoglobin
MKTLIQPFLLRSARHIGWARHALGCVVLAFVIFAPLGCGIGRGGQKDEFFTSGSREADQRANQRMAKHEQLTGNGEGAEVAERDEETIPLYDRLGGEETIAAIVDDFTTRVIQDPRVNWERRGVRSGGTLFRRGESMTWEPTVENVTRLKRHMAQFLSLATGGPAQYDGENIESSHAGMRITNAEFDATIGDLKASLDNLQIPSPEQKELLAIVESTRPQIVTER